MKLSERKHGIHFYINISNFNKVVSDEEEKTHAVNHSLHALDTYYSSIERYGKSKYGDKGFVVEKITGARLHMYIVDEISSAYKCVENIASYAYRLSKLINREIPKYKTLLDFQIQIGACFGDFYEYNFKNMNKDGQVEFEEFTSIGYAANYAAKLQGLAGNSRICISEKIFNECVEADLYIRCESETIKKYNQECYYESELELISDKYEISDKELTSVRDYANKVNLTDMFFSTVNQKLSFSTLSKTNGKKVVGVLLFADIRDFTSKFEEDDSNLEKMVLQTEHILSDMYNTTLQHGGVHIQFQGDREEVLFYDVENIVCIEDAILAGMRMIDNTSLYGVRIGIGADYGKLYAAKIGARGEKDNILLGETIITADRLEDDKAEMNQIAISDYLYQELVKMNSSLVRYFKKDKNVYIASIGYQDYLADMMSVQHQNATRRGDYNGAWREFN